ncbi:MAG TPA: OmpA family protein [Polyangiaceae bacterium]|jgi:outer membrane protein OmpA-like peptidoglycan-associated protein
MKIRIALVASLLAFAPLARAQTELDTQRFKPAVTSDGWVNAEGSGVNPTEDPLEIGIYANYARNALVAVDAAGNLGTRYVSGRLGFDALLSISVARPFAIGLDVPFFVAQTGDTNPSSVGLGDVRVVPKIQILDDIRHPLGLAIVAEIAAPTHLGDFAGGARYSPVFTPRLVIDHRFGASGLRLGANAGVAIREITNFMNVTSASEFVYDADIAYRFGGRAGPVELGFELAGGIGLKTVDTPEIPLEGLPYLRIVPSDQWDIQAGAGIGFVAGFGTPVARGFLGVRFHPVSHDRDHDGVPDDRDQCPDIPEDRDGYQDWDGCPEHDADHDGVPDSMDKCPHEKETINGYKDDDGCPDVGPAQVIVENGHITILRRVTFREGSAEIDPQSYSILNQVALVMRAHPEIRRIRVEGHTDELGTHEYNMVLSRERAGRVREYLISRGVRPSRLGAVGYGPDRPLVRGTTEAAHAKNRRVEFVVEE